ncbi:EamA family transporter [Cellulomonas soli]|uniref:Permease n=1 Tax=Cellulomonas soli TaxID=931535 RepID=A0A512PCF8_9CELL|nr:EamA family transporter [Cellulomonas soli]NYI58470.1 inner membrane transporter RhtA [Cellulomonas soli]GEP68893.1 permease [Cellulomonas soli]
MPAPLIFVLSGLTQYVGAALAVGLFGELPPATVAWLRVAIAAVVLLGWRRPWRVAWTRAGLRTAALFGVVLALMNVAFYIGIDHLPLGTAVAIEFLGPVGVAAATGSGWRDRAGIGLAASGVVLLAGVSLTGGEEAVVGLVAIGIAAVCWAGYILLGRRVASAGEAGGITGLAVGMSAGGLVLAPVFAASASPVLHDARLAAVLVAIAVCSSVVPYALEQVVLRRVPPATFAILLALLPATAAVVGAVMLRQWPHGLEVVGLVLVSAAIALTGQARRPQADVVDEVPPV